MHTQLTAPLIASAIAFCTSFCESAEPTVLDEKELAQSDLIVEQSAQDDYSAIVIEHGSIWYRFPFTLPTAREVLNALPNPDLKRHHACIVCHLLNYSTGDSRFYPLVGPARLQHAHFKCEVYSDHGKEVVFIDHDRLIRAADASGG